MENDNPLIHKLLGTHEEAHRLSVEDPEEFERRKHLIIKEYIESLPEERRQYAIKTQHLIETKTRKIKDPLVKATITYSLMNDSLLELNESLKPFKKKEEIN